MALGLSPVEELKKKVELLTSKIESLSSGNNTDLLQRIEEVEDLQLLEKLNSIEMREEIQNIRSEIEGMGLIKHPSGSTSSTSANAGELASRVQDLESKLQELEILALGSGGKKEDGSPVVDLDSLKEELLKELQRQNPIKSEGSSQPVIDMKGLEESILSKVDDKLKSLKPGKLGGLFSKSLQQTPQENADLKISIKSELLSDMRSMVEQEVGSKLSDIPTAGVSRADLKARLSKFKTELIEGLNIEKVIDKKLNPVVKSLEHLEDRFSKNDSQLTTLFSTLPREIKLVKDDMNMRLESHEKSIDQLRREVKEVRLGGIEGYQYLVTKEEARRIADEKVNALRNEVLANKLAGDDEKYEEAMNRIMALDDRFSVLKAEILPTVERVAELDRLSAKLSGIEDDINNYVHSKLSQIDPAVINTIVNTIDQLRERIEGVENEPSEFVKRSIEALKLAQDRDREAYDKIAKFVHLETERIAAVNDDLKTTVVSRLDEFEQRIPPEDVWIEIESLRSRLAALEKTQKEMTINVRKKAVAQPAIIE